ncbi:MULTISPECIES: two-component system sensor histidine kinase ZraS [Citrobacter]|uniref:two-component system sensor histidine kinase ZraS n=1 Tax=Citrobacter TaxID=544 RepID=UPI0015EA872D|nr:MULTISPECIES: two-component system sensor histidine kinase ZraS [Citrobacter]EHG7584063.1 two-component system sensor histidine kinase ZraS [Citrobacter sedlakii]EIQ7160261.1 two-component system sensor histidine kinase ZraS [Citrobacter sedlakii]MBN6600767.1 two-component system sensor histidine kinase ZraS [Citrobacter sedlakii]QMK47943.1 two-component system sensor histidine kinase ZraS [Citrobacter sp. RHB21-C05]QMK66386.1 two-component system sensor histidine kinase ZraS [Citrobacter s
MRHHKDTVTKWLSGILPVAILILVGLFAAAVIRDYGRESDSARQTLLEKGGVLIRALESGTRVGMGMRMHHAQQQTLLEEMAGQPGVLWFAVTDAQGNILMHSDPARVGGTLYAADEIQRLQPGEDARWRSVDAVDEQGETVPALEIYRQFQPLHSPGRHGMGAMPRCEGRNAGISSTPQTIFIAFDASELATTQAREWRNMLIMLFALTTVLLATLLAFFWYRRYLRSRQLLQDEMNRQEKLLALGHLAAGVAHEIRNPLSSIKGLARYFAERAPAGGEAHALAQVMAKEADRLNRVVSELLELVKPAHLTLQPVDLNTVITHSLQLVSQDAQSRAIELRFTPNAALPLIQADPDRLTQVLLNLYLNAIHAIDRQGTINVDISMSGADRVKIVVADSGKGIAPEQLETIFTPYYTTKAEGTGLGLAVVQNIIEQHGGTIKAESPAGKGAIFTLWLPVKAKQKEVQG